MNKTPIIVLFTLLVCAFAWASGRDEGYGEGDLTRGGYQRGQGSRGFQRDQGYQRDNFDGPPGRGGRQQYGDSKRYRSNLYSDDDVYGYDANYPNGEAVYINYRNKDARARRGPEFARTSRAYSRQGGQGGQGGQGEQRGYERSFGFGPIQGVGRGMW